MKSLENCKIAVIGLGYVGLPLAVEFSAHFDTIGYDTDSKRINDLKSGIDVSQETTAEVLRSARNLTYTNKPGDLSACDVYIVTVPTPVDVSKNPDLTLLRLASKTVGGLISKDNIVIFESTVYPGATEEVCVPIIESESGLSFNSEFFVGYSPERVNPGDKEHRISSIKKVTSGSTLEAAEFIDKLYRKIILAGTFRASSIMVAEAAKVIENIQRDVNIALINELALIFNLLGIDTLEVLEAAGSKWNFLPFRPGLVGGHCIGVDPYYLTHKAQSVGYHPEVILAGRRVNDGMGSYIVGQLLKLMIQKGMSVTNSRVLIMGLTFKENCPDIRNTRVTDMIDEFSTYGINPDVYDPWVVRSDAERTYNIVPIEKPEQSAYDAIIIAVAHSAFRDMGIEAIRALGKDTHVLYDVKYMFPAEEVDGRL